MTIMKPNRIRVQLNDGGEIHRKQSGDQHLFPTDDPESDPHRPHRTNRRDMQKTMPRGSADIDRGDD
ncbi:MAG: hypothetical protein ACO1NO_00765 [Burkholderiaceae bacterium]